MNHLILSPVQSPSRGPFSVLPRPAAPPQQLGNPSVLLYGSVLMCGVARNTVSVSHPYGMGGILCTLLTHPAPS